MQSSKLTVSVAGIDAKENLTKNFFYRCVEIVTRVFSEIYLDLFTIDYRNQYTIKYFHYEIIVPINVLFTKYIYHEKWCKYMGFGECCGMQNIVLDMGRFVKSCIITFNCPRLFQEKRRVYSSPLVFSSYSSALRNGS